MFSTGVLLVLFSYTIPHAHYFYADFLCIMVAAAWWLGKMSVSAMTTFSLLPAAKTMASAMSSPVSGSHPLCDS